MSMKAETREMIWDYMMQHIEDDDPDMIQKTISNFEVSKTTVYNYLKKMTEKGLTVKSDIRWCGYRMNDEMFFFSYDTADGLWEDRIYNEDIRPLLTGCSENALDIIYYTFSEMMNNAIEHAKATTINVTVAINTVNIKIVIDDDGVGIFRNIQDYFKRKGEKISLDEAVYALIPGKLTTAESGHSGEGIFFSSKIADRFIIVSDKKVFRIDSFSKVMEDVDPFKGTAVGFWIAKKTAKKAKDIFEMYADGDKGFFKTKIPIAYMFASGKPVARSEARRLAEYIKGFEEVTLDFQNVESIGQAFTHEMFIVFQNRHPEIRINVENVGEDVQKMISRVLHTK